MARQMVLFLILALVVEVQELQAQKFNAGVFGGLNASQIDRDGFGGYNKLGINAGAYVNREFSDNFYWQLELKYSPRGSYMLNMDNVFDFQKTVFRYFELPLSVHYLHEEKYQVELGISPDVLLSFAAYDDQRLQVPVTEPLGGNRRFGLNGFAGVNYWMKPTFGIGLRFSYSIIPYSLREGASVRYLDSGYFHNVLSLTLAYSIRHL